MNNWLVPTLIILFAWRVCHLQDASASIRVIRSSENSSRFVHHALEEEGDSATTDPSKALLCHLQNQTNTNISIDEVDAIRRRKRRETDDVIRGLKRSEAVDAIRRRERRETDEEVDGNSTEMVDVECPYSDELCDCDAQTLVEKNCFEKLPNGSVYVPIYKRLFGPMDYHEDELGDIYVCPEFFKEHVDGTKESKFPAALSIVTVVGIVISTLCIVVHMAMFLMLEKLRNLPGYCLFSMCVALMVAYTCTFIPYARKEVSDCTAVGTIKAYSFLASFFWMNVMAYDIWRSLRLATAKLRLTGQRPMMTRFAMYSAYSWGCPLLIILIGFIVTSIEETPDIYRMDMAQETCWFHHKPALQVYFAFPLFALLVLNFLLFVFSFVMISGATMKTSDNRADLWPRFLVSLRLAVVMGLMWTFGVLATATEAQWLWYFYVLCNVLQGMFIFFSFTLTDKTRKEARKALASKKSSVFRTLTTLQSTSTSV